MNLIKNLENDIYSYAFPGQNVLEIDVGLIILKLTLTSKYFKTHGRPAGPFNRIDSDSRYPNHGIQETCNMCFFVGIPIKNLKRETIRSGRQVLQMSVQYNY